MTEWLTLPRVFLVAAPVAMVLAANALAAGERRAKAQRARDALGPPTRDAEQATVGARVILEGTLQSNSEPCARFEDGHAAAAVTVEAEGFRAAFAPPDVRVNWAIGEIEKMFIAKSARASDLSLVVGKETIALEGAVDVLVGSHEMDPNAPFASLSPAVRERITLVAGADAVPGATAWAPVLSRPLFRSVAEGTRVRVAGTLTKRSEGDRTGYRERGKFALIGDEDHPLVIAFAGAPSYGGAFAAVARGVRRTSALGAVVFVIVAFSLVGIVLARAHHAALHKPRGTPAPMAGMGAVRPLADPERCAVLKREYDASTTVLTSCSSDAQCTSETRGGAFFGLEGCHRFRNREVSAARLDPIEEMWMREGCATSFELCPPAPPAVCTQGQCAELPPEPIPRSWRREGDAGLFFFYVPAGVHRIDAGGLDTDLAVYRGNGIEITTEVGQYAPAPTEEHEGRVVTIGGQQAEVTRSSRNMTVVFDLNDLCKNTNCAFVGVDRRLSLRARCESQESCEDAWISLSSVHFW
ncbi:MAG: hypothetical protein IPK82_38925 [Polyangiaceae bacterium]|nr:hypothetical protein [Polyangiaceae bacterium]